MFSLIFALVCIVPNIYLFFRIRHLFISKKLRIYYALFYLLMVLVYPINTYLIEGNFELKYNPISLIARYILPYYLYVVLLMLLFDLFMLLNRLFKIVSVNTMKGNRFKATTLAVILVVPIGITVYGIINFNTIQISEYQITVPKKSSNIDHLKIAFASDFHLKQRTDIHFVERFAAKIESIHPDLLIFGGDIAEGYGEGEKMVRIAKMFREFHPRYGVFGVLGNHEYYGSLERGRFFDLAGIQMLGDSVAIVGNSFNLAGRLDNRYRDRLTTAELLKSINDSLPVILVDHRPTDIVENSKTAADIQFSGHTHNGQLFPFNWIINSMYPMRWGTKKLGNTHFFLSSGIMMWGPPVRTTGKSEIMVVDVEFK
jgi:predicted MPP superfamily phosphohydrolase